MKGRYLLFVLLLISCEIINAQNKPFPQEEGYKNGFQAGNFTSQDALNSYNKWKNLFLVECNEFYRVEAGSNQTLSESMGYGMLLTAYYGEREYYDGLLGFYKSKRNANANNLMGWKVTCSGFVDKNCATDGDLDVAFSLIVAYKQWGGTYLDDAKAILTIFKNKFFVKCSDVYILYPGVGWGGCSLTDISYYTPAYFRVFAEVTQDNFWNEVTDDAYVILDNGADETTGLVPDWQSWDGKPGGNPKTDRVDYYRYDASRTPWRMSLDYLWNGNAIARDWCAKITTWANSIGASNIKDGYQLDGTVMGQYNNSAFVGGFAVGAMCNSQTTVNSFASRLKQLENVGWDDTYFNLSLRCLYGLALSGNYWEPSLSSESSEEIKYIKNVKLINNHNSNEIRLEGLRDALSVEIISLTGQVLLSKLNIIGEQADIEISSLEKGFYFAVVDFRSGNNQSIKFQKY